MKKILLTVAIASTLIACKKSDYTISGTTENLKDGAKVYLNKIENGNMVAKDSTTITNNTFTFEGNTEEAEYSYIKIETPENGSLHIPFILEKGEIKIQIDTNNNKISGTPNNEALNSFVEKSKTISKELQEFENTNGAKFQKASEENDQKTIDALMTEYEKIQGKLTTEISTFIDQNKDAYTSILLLYQYGNLFSEKEFQTKFNSLSTEMKNTKLGKEISEKIKKMEALSIGSKAPDFSAKNTEGVETSLYKNLGKITIIDFWASWCGPCRQENPNVVKLYNQYKDKGLQIIGVSLDKEEAKWKKAIADDNLTWIQISNLKFWQDPIAKLYNIEGIPATYILDEKGTIIAKDLRGKELENKIAELLK